MASRFSTLSALTARGLSAAAAAPPPKSFSEIPGPRQLPLIGNGREMMANSHRIQEYIHENFKYGEIYKLRAFNTNFVIIKDPSSIAYVLKAEGKYRQRDTTMSHGVNWLIKNRMKTLPPMGFEFGERWKRLRIAMSKQATPRNVLTYASGFNKIYRRFVDYIRNARGADNVVADITYPIQLLFTEISVYFVFGNMIDVLNDPSGQFKKLVDSIGLHFDAMGQLVAAPPLYKLYNNKISRDFVQSRKVVYNIAKKEIEKLYFRLEKEGESKIPGLMEQWLREKRLCEEEIVNEASHTFFVGVDTTANQSVFLLHLMAKHPEAQERLYQELKSVIGDSREVTPEHLPQLPYLKGCMLESFRLSSTIGIITRVLDEECQLLGYTIPPETMVWYSMYSAGRDEGLFPDPMKFDPGRWKRDKMHAFAIQPFGFGPGACYGRRFAELEMKLLLAQIILNFKLNAEKNEIKCVQQALLVPDEDVPIKFVVRP